MDQEIWQPYKDEGVVVITIGSDSFTQYKQKEQQYNTGWVWLFDTAAQLEVDYGVWFYPSNFMIDQELRLAYRSSYTEWTLSTNTMYSCTRSIPGTRVCCPATHSPST